MKEGDDFASVILQITHRAANLLREIFLTGDRHATDGIRFQMLPDQLVGVAVDTEAADITKFAVYDKPLANDDVSLMQQVALIVPFASLIHGARRVLLHA